MVFLDQVLHIPPRFLDLLVLAIPGRFDILSYSIDPFFITYILSLSSQRSLLLSPSLVFTLMLIDWHCDPLASWPLTLVFCNTVL